MVSWTEKLKNLLFKFILLEYHSLRYYWVCFIFSTLLHKSHQLFHCLSIITSQDLSFPPPNLLSSHRLRIYSFVCYVLGHTICSDKDWTRFGHMQNSHLDPYLSGPISLCLGWSYLVFFYCCCWIFESALCEKILNTGFYISTLSGV